MGYNMKTIKILIVMMFMAMPAFSQTGMPSITVTEAEKDFTLPIKRAKVDVKIVGSLAITTFDIHFYNPNKRTLEGQLDFPLAEGVIVSRFAMDVNKKLREGVIVEKDKGRQTFEKIVKRRVDPGLLEVTRGSNFRSRVYPLLPEHEKHIVIAYEEELKVTPDGLRYSLPLDMPNKLDEFSFKATIYSDFAEPINNSTNSSKFRHKTDSYTLLSEYTDYKAKELYEFIIPYFGEQSVQLETYNNEDFFRISLNPDMMLQQKEKPQTISILWDISASRLNSDIKKDLELLEEYLEYNKCNVELVPFSLYADEPSYFQNVDFAELKANIKGLRIDGATNYSSVDISKLRGEEIFIFSDGIDNIGEGGFGETEKPMYIINSSSISDHDVCRKLAQKTGGKYINLIDENTQSALNLLTYNFPYFMGIEGAASQVYPKNEVVKGNINISGKLQSSSQIKLKFGYGNKVAKTIPINITEANCTNSGILHKIWAKQKLADLNLNQKQNEVEITNLAKQYSLVTAFTSLIVLETARDYYWYKIEPPDELREEYDSVKARYERSYYVRNRDHVADSLRYVEALKNSVLRYVNELKTWSNIDYSQIEYLDSCYNLMDKKVGELVKNIDFMNDSIPYYVINLKEHFPQFDFRKNGYLNYTVLNNVDEDYDDSRFYKSLPFNKIVTEDTSFLMKRYISNYGLGKYGNIHVNNFRVHNNSFNGMKKLVFEANSSYHYEFGLANTYKNLRNIKLDSNSRLTIEIETKDLDQFYNKLYILKEGGYYLAEENLFQLKKWISYEDKLDRIFRSSISDLEKYPSDDLFTTIDLDSLLPEYKDLNQVHFKYFDMSWNDKFNNKINDSIYNYDISHYKYFYDNSSQLDSNKMLLENKHYTSNFNNKQTYWENWLRGQSQIRLINRTHLQLDGLYFVSSLPYSTNKDKIRDKFRNQIANIGGNIAIKIAKDSTSLDYSKVYLFKNIAMIIDKDYLGNLTTQHLINRNKELYRKNWQLGEQNTEELLEVIPIENISPGLKTVEDNALRIGLNPRGQYNNNHFTIDSVFLYSNNFRYSAKILTTKHRYYNYTESQYIYYSEKDLADNDMTEIDSITVKFSFIDSTVIFNNEAEGELTFDAKEKQFKYTIPHQKLENYQNNFLTFNTPKIHSKYLSDKIKYEIKNCSAYLQLSKYNLKGTVVDENGKPLPGATVMLLGTKKGAKTKPNGKFIINKLPLGIYMLRVTHVAKAEQIMQINTAIENNFKIVMQPRVSRTSNVVVMSDRAKVTNTDGSVSIRGARGADTQILVEGMDMSNRFTGGMGIGGSKNFPDDQEPSANAVVTTEEYQSSKEYYKELSSVGLGELEDTYFELREDNQMNPAFFFDAAKVFEKNGKIKEACRVISNLAEINLEDHENLRRVAGFMMEHKEYTFAKSIYQHILKIRNEEPQSFRDYALCLAKSGEYQAAADSLYNLFTSDIAWEFSGIRSTLITEFNTLLDEHKGEIDISKYEPEYIFKTPVDLRIEITWAMDETDVDLWVIEPDNTKCFYSHRYTKNGGFLSQDMRRGYGPEVYMIKKATPGKYKIRANYYSNRRQKSSIDPQVRCKIYTNYGRPNQQMQENVIKIEIDHGEVDLGEIEIE